MRLNGWSLLIMEFSNVVSQFAVFLTIVLNCTGILTCRKIISDKSVGTLNYIPFLCGIVMFCYWMLYGVLINDVPIILVNSIGTILQIIYFTIYSIYTDNKPTVIKGGCLAGVVISFAIAAVILLPPSQSVNTSLGLTCNVLSVLFFASPLSDMSQVFKTKSTESMSFPLTIMSLLVTFFWGLYGHLINDYLVLFPNCLGFLLAIVQLSLFIKFPRRQQSLPQ